MSGNSTDAWGSACVVCDGRLSDETINVKEMMFGIGESFAYHQCRDCGSLQIAAIPADMSPYYPSDYYSYQDKKGVIDRVGRHLSKFRTPLCRVPALHRLVRSAIGLFLSGEDEYEVIKALSPYPASRFLDVGCGSGRSLKMLRFLGYTNLVGIDPYLGMTAEEPGLRLLRKGIHDVDDEFDIILFNHSLEHIPWPKRTIAKAHSLLPAGGYVVLRTPVAQSFAWSKYREHWVQLDAPRHLFIPSVKGLERLSAASGFRLTRVIHDSSEFQFWGSEQYLRCVTLMSPESYGVNPKGSLFTPEQIEAFKKMAKELNACGQGDQVIAFLRKTSLP